MPRSTPRAPRPPSAGSAAADHPESRTPGGLDARRPGHRRINGHRLFAVSGNRNAITHVNAVADRPVGGQPRAATENPAAAVGGDPLRHHIQVQARACDPTARPYPPRRFASAAIVAAASAVIRSTISAAGSAWLSACACPAHRFTSEASSAARAAARSGAVTLCRCGYARGAALSCARMNSLTTPRASRPVKARVSRVSPEPETAARCTFDVPASALRRNAVPSAPAAAPAASTAARPGPSAIPPAATSGSRDRAATRRSNGSRAYSSVSSTPPRCAPRPIPCTTSASTLTSSAGATAPGCETVTHTSLPWACSASTTSTVGRPKANDTTGTGSSSRSRSFSGYRSSPPTAAPSTTPHRFASGARRSTYAVTAVVSTFGLTGANTFTPNGRSVRRRVSAMSAASRSGVRYPAPRKPNAPALQTAATSSGVDGPPAIGAAITGRLRVSSTALIAAASHGQPRRAMACSPSRRSWSYLHGLISKPRHFLLDRRGNAAEAAPLDGGRPPVVCRTYLVMKR